MRTWIYTESVGNGVFNIAQLDNDFKFVWIDKYGIANIFNEMGEFMRYCEGDLDCERECLEITENEEDELDTLDKYLNIDD